MKDHTPIIAMLAALAMMLGALLALAISVKDADKTILVTLANGAIGIAGAIGGFSMNSSRVPPQISNSPGAQVVNEIPNEPSR